VKSASAANPDLVQVYIGSYSSADEPGIHLLELNTTTGELTKKSATLGIAKPSFLAIHPDKTSLYAVSEIDDLNGAKTGGVAAFRINKDDGSLTPLNVRASQGAGPCHLNVDPTGRNVLVANYGSGSVAVLPINEDGSLKKTSCSIQHQTLEGRTGRQAGPHAHSITLDQSGNYAFAADLGLDQVMIYRFDAEAGMLTASDPPAGIVAQGSGPRHFDFHPSGKFAYVINELSSTITLFDFDASAGSLTPKQTITTLPNGAVKGNSTADIHVHPSGKFLYGSNRGDDSIVVYAIDPDNGKLTQSQRQPTLGKTPRNFGIDPSGHILLAENQGSDSIVTFKINQKTGHLKPTGHSIEIAKPVCARFVIP